MPTGQLAVDGTQAFTPFSTAELLRLAGAVEAASEHPIAHAIAAAAVAAERQDGGGGRLPGVTGFRSAPGGGVQGIVQDRLVTAGRTGWLQDNGVSMTPAQEGLLRRAKNPGGTAMAASSVLAVANSLRLRGFAK